jgi:hypothetical protein
LVGVLEVNMPRFALLASGAVYLACLLLLGAALGLALASRVLPLSSDMGWDQLADALAGTLVGGVAGFVLGIFTLQYFRPARRFKLAAVALLAAMLTLAYLHTVPPAYSTASTLPGFMMPFGSSVFLS